jgi:hypothetical protein
VATLFIRRHGASDLGEPRWHLPAVEARPPKSPLCQDPQTGLPSLGGFWGWIEFDQWSNGSITGDAELTGCGVLQVSYRAAR